MLKPGEKGAILQRDKQTYAIAPHVPCGMLTPDQLRRIADAAEKYGAQAVKITGAQRIAIIGLAEKDIDGAWTDLGMDPGHAVGLCVRSIRVCPGNTYCRLGQQDTLTVGMEMDRRYHGRQLPGKLKMAVSGCNLNCCESLVRDIGLIGKPEGWTVVIGGNVGAMPRVAKAAAAGLDDDAALSAVDRLVAYYADNAKKGERLGKMLERIGMDPFVDAIG